jgi:hypothetical protein
MIHLDMEKLGRFDGLGQRITGDRLGKAAEVRPVKATAGNSPMSRRRRFAALPSSR